MNSKTVQYFLLFFAVLGLSASAIFVKLADAPSSIIAFYRLLFASILLLPLFLLNKKRILELKNIKFKDSILGIISGIFLSSHYILWFESLNYTSIASSTVIVNLQALFAFIAGVLFFKEKNSFLSLLGCLIGILGCAIIGLDDFKLNPKALFGDILSLIAAGAITAYYFTSQTLKKKFSTLTYSLFGYIVSSILLLIYTLFTQDNLFNYSKETWLSIFGLALVSTVLGQLILNLLLKYISVTAISMCILGESIGACILAYIIFDESLSLKQFIGISIILIGLGIYFLNKRKK